MFFNRNDLGDTINPVLYQDDIHVYESDIGKLANNTRASICRALNKEFISTKRNDRNRFKRGRNC